MLLCCCMLCCFTIQYTAPAAPAEYKLVCENVVSATSQGSDDDPNNLQSATADAFPTLSAQVEAEIAEIETMIGKSDRAVLDHFSAKTGIDFPPEILAERQQEYFRQAAANLETFPGLPQLLADLADIPPQLYFVHQVPSRAQRLPRSQRDVK